MQQILIYSDSLTWGIIPNTRQRLPFDKRWPGVFENTFNALGQNIRVIENCLNGRRTVWSDPFKDGRDGSKGLAQVIEMHSPLDWVVLLLGSNDFQCTHDNNAWLSAQGMTKLVRIIRQAPIEPGMPVPEIMIVAPPTIVKPKGVIAHKFLGSEVRCVGLAAELEQVANENSAHFFNAGDVTEASVVDGIHLDEDQHEVLGKALAHEIARITNL
ncbi:SGNH/GDSL hydrolase family protein [Sessilibacter corallicola]|uniref:SGNH/GDSL hydrolase family protein n=1 Tax=Sessilibacter corallicola TaxID=2904075 RepID=UPI001E4E6988|nr:SGNH/GDSL hydrolase family protein [Sessilibacter corallicola]MCE2030013.1 SGNH/GDSL hydrolase family protein [Sessilibacter corallicola]